MLRLLIFLLPIVTAIPIKEDKTAAPFKNGSQPVVVQKRPSLDELLQAYNLHDLENLASGRTKREACLIAPELLTDLAESLRNIQAYVPKTGDSPLTIKEPQPLPTVDKGTPCDQAKLKLQGNVDSLSTIYLILLINGETLTDDEFKRLKTLYEKVHATLGDDVKTIKEAIDVAARDQIEDVINEKTSLEARLERLVKDLEYKATTKKQLVENTVDLIVADIYQGKYTPAKEKFLTLPNMQMVYNVVDKMAEKPNHENMLKFTKELPWLIHRMRSYNAMLDKGNLGYWLFSVEYDYKELMGFSNDPEVVRGSQNDINNIEKRIKQLVNDLLQKTADQIATKEPKNYNDLIQYSKSQQPQFNAHLEEIVEKVYENSNNDVDIIEQILLFADELTIIAQSARVYVKLYKLMETNREISFHSALKIAFKVKELSLMKNHVNTPDEVKKEMEELKDKTPDSVRSIIWGQVCIKNEALDGYIHDKGTFDYARKNVVIAPEKDLWVFESTDNANSFKIKNVKSKEYLYAEGNEMAYSAFKRRIFTWRGDNNRLFNQFWLLEDFGMKIGRFLIKNKERNEYLNAEKLPEEETKPGDIEPELDAIMKKDSALAEQIKQLLEAKKKIDPLQVFTWRRRSRGNNAEWIIVDSTQCQ